MLASSSHDQTVRLWDVTTGQLLDVLRGHVSGVAAIAIGADGKTLASGGGDGVIRLWELQMSGQCRIVRTFQGSAGGFENLAISATGILADGVIMAAGGTRGWCHIWSMQGVLSPDAVTDDATPGHQDIRVRYQFALKGHRGTILTVAFRPNSPQVATGGNDETIRIWDAMSGRCLVVLQDPNATVSSVAYNPQGTRLASGEKNGVIHLWTIDDWGHYQLRHTIQASQRDVWAIAISPDGQTLASTALDRRVRLWDVETGACLQSLDLPDTHARTISFDPQGTRLAVAQVNGNIRLWNIVDRALVENTQTLRHTQAPINAVAFTPSGELLVSGAAEPILCIWDTMTGEKRHALSGCGQAIKDVALWPSSNIMASTGTDGLIRLSDIASGSVLHTINAPGPYEGMNITGVTGISEAQRSALKALGAVEAGEAGLSIVSPTKPD
jgi:WD40 repeat protein